MSGVGGNVETNIKHDGVMIDFVINHPSRQFAGTTVRGLIDTGADFVLIAPAIAKKLQLKHRDNAIVGGIGGEEVAAKVYSGCLEVPKLGNFVKVLPVYAVPWGSTTHHVLLGRSFLRHFVFRYDGPSETFHFSLPLNPEQMVGAKS